MLLIFLIQALFYALVFFILQLLFRRTGGGNTRLFVCIESHRQLVDPDAKEPALEARQIVRDGERDRGHGPGVLLKLMAS